MVEVIANKFLCWEVRALRWGDWRFAPLDIITAPVSLNSYDQIVSTEPARELEQHRGLNAGYRLIFGDFDNRPRGTRSDFST
jgi:hypothetical protein